MWWHVSFFPRRSCRAEKPYGSSEELREEEHSNVAILLDTKGPEIRTGLLKDGKKIMLEAGKKFTLTTEEVAGDENIVSISYRD